MATGKPLCSTGSSAWCSVMTSMGGWGGREEAGANQREGWLVCAGKDEGGGYGEEVEGIF